MYTLQTLLQRIIVEYFESGRRINDIIEVSSNVEALWERYDEGCEHAYVWRGLDAATKGGHGGCGEVKHSVYTLGNLAGLIRSDMAQICDILCRHESVDHAIVSITVTLGLSAAPVSCLHTS